MDVVDLKAPFPWTGGKSRAAHLVWPRFGDTLNYTEPFYGSGAVHLARPFPIRTETINDKDAYVANYWRATQADPEQVAHYADWPVNEADLHARHSWLVQQRDFRERMMADPDYYDPKVAGWWVWGLSAWIGSGWCDSKYYEEKGKTRYGKTRPNLRPKQGVQSLRTARKLPRVSANQGVNSQNVQTSRQIPALFGMRNGNQLGLKGGSIRDYMIALQERLRRVRVVCGDWQRITGPSVTYKIGMTAVFLDPPYGPDRQAGLYAEDSLTVADEVREWCLEDIKDGKTFQGPRYLHPKLRIALCGLDGEHNELEELGWEVVAWKANGGYGNQGVTDNRNAGKERIWFSPNCIRPEEARQPKLPIGSNYMPAYLRR